MWALPIYRHCLHAVVSLLSLGVTSMFLGDALPSAERGSAIPLASMNRTVADSLTIIAASGRPLI